MGIVGLKIGREKGEARCFPPGHTKTNLYELERKRGKHAKQFR